MKKLLLASFVCVSLVACAESVTQKSIEQSSSQNPINQPSVSPMLSFFVTSDGKGDGANLGGLAGADAHCETLASNVGQGGKGWRAYLSTTGEGGVNARDRIGTGPWFNANGEQIAANLTELHGENNITGESTLTEMGDEVPWRLHDDGVSKRAYHDMFTGTQNDGTALNSGEDTTCSNWTSGGEGTALLGHSNRGGGAMTENPGSTPIPQTPALKGAQPTPPSVFTIVSQARHSHTKPSPKSCKRLERHDHMSELPPCPQCACEYSYEDGALLVCPECAHEWSDNPEFSTERIYKDANGNILVEGDMVTIIKDLKVKGTSKVAKVGTKVRIQRLIDEDHDIDCKIDGIGAMKLKTMFVKKA